MLSKNAIGIDYHLNSVRVCVMQPNGKKLGNQKLNNSVGEIIRYVKQFGEVGAGAVEVSCGAATFVDELKTASGWDIRLCHPGYVNRMKNSPDKSDKSDAELLADLCRVGYLPEVWLAPEELRDLRQLVRFRSQQVNRQKATKLRIRATLRNFRIQTPPRFEVGTKWSRKWLESELERLPEHSRWIIQMTLLELDSAKNLIGLIEKRLAKWAKSDRLCRWLMQQRGIGLIIATLIRVEVGTATRFSRSKQFARFCGLTPRNCSSGERQADSGLIHAGNSKLKCAIIQVSHLLRRYDPHWKEFGAKLAEKGKPVCVVVAAIANRWLRRLFHEMRNFEIQSQLTV